MQPRAILQMNDNRVVELGHGDIIGRLRSCQLVCDDVRISEAHAFVSLRGDALRLLGLRGRFWVDGVASTDVALRAGQQLSFIDDTRAGFSADVVEVVLPDAVVAIECEGLPLQVLLGTTSIVAAPKVSFRSGIVVGALGFLAFDDGGWRLQRASGEQQLLEPDVPFTLTDPRTGVVVRGVPRLVALSEVGAAPTQAQPSSSSLPLRIVARYDSVHIFQGGDAPKLVLNGVGAQLVSELVASNGPVAWHVVAREIWQDFAVEPVLRGRWDAQVSRLRSRLRQAGLRPDLVRPNNVGLVELVLGRDDVVVDEQ